MTRCLGIDGPRTQKFRRFYNGTTGKPKPSDLEYYITSLFKAFLPSPFTVALPRSDKIGLSSLANSMYNLQFSESMATIISLPQVPQHDPTPSHSAASFPEVEVPIPTHAPESEENPTYEWIFAHLQSFNCDQVSKMCQIIAKADPDQVKLAVLLVQIFPYVTDQVLYLICRFLNHLGKFWPGLLSVNLGGSSRVPENGNYPGTTETKDNPHLGACNRLSTWCGGQCEP